MPDEHLLCRVCWLCVPSVVSRPGRGCEDRVLGQKQSFRFPTASPHIHPSCQENSPPCSKFLVTRDRLPAPKGFKKWTRRIHKGTRSPPSFRTSPDCFLGKNNPRLYPTPLPNPCFSLLPLPSHVPYTSQNSPLFTLSPLLSTPISLPL